MNYPPEDLGLNTADVKILWMLSNNPHCRWSHFINEPLKIPSATLSKYINRMIENDYIERQLGEEGKKIYKIMSKGERELIRRFDKPELDFYEMIELERKKIQSQVSKLSPFFKKYKISDDLVKIDFLSLYDNLIRDDSLSIFSEEQFNILILYIVLNDVKYFEKVENVLTVEEFIEKIDVDPEIYLTKTDIMMFIQEVVDKNRYGINIFKIPLMKDNVFLFFGEDSVIGTIFETIIKKHLRNLNYLKSLNNSEIYISDLEDIMKPIMYDLTKRYKIFNKEIEEEIFHLVEDYITDLQFELHEKPFIEFDKIREYFSLYSPYVGFTYPFKPLSEEDEQELKDVHTIFQRIREKEPKNKLLSKTSDYLYENKLEEALIEVNKCLEIDSKDPETLELKSRILYESGNFEKALEIFEEAQKNKTDIENTFEKVYTDAFRVELYLALKRYEKALDIIKKDIPMIIRDDEEYDELKFFKENYYLFQLFKYEATIHFEQEKYNEALEAINKDIKYMERFVGMDENESIADSYKLKLKLLKKLDKYDEINKIIKIVLKLRLNDPELLFEIVEIDLLLNPIKSFFTLIKILKLRPLNEKYQNFYKKMIAIPLSILYVADSYLRISKEISKIFESQRRGMTFIELNQKLHDSGVLESLVLPVKEELTKPFDFFIEQAIKRKAIELNDDLYLQNSNVMREYIRELERGRLISLINCYYINLLHAYRNNDWKEFLKENLISKLIIEISGDKLEEIASSLIDNLLVKKFLTETKENLITIDRDKFEEQFSKVKYDIEMEETNKFISDL